MRVLFLTLAMVLLTACQSTVPAPMADVPPAPVPELKQCSIAGDADSFTMTCSPVPTPTVEPTATPTPSFWYFWCQGDKRCASGQFRVYWDRPLSLLRCALPTGSKVTVIATGLSGRVPEESEQLAWVVTGADAGNGTACEGWTPLAFLAEAR